MALTDIQKSKIHELIYNAGKEYIPVQELTHAANEIVKDPTDEKVNEMITYLNEFPYQRMDQPTFMPTTSTTSMSNNSIRLAMSEVRKIINDTTKMSGEDDEPLEDNVNPVNDNPDSGNDHITDEDV